jgi:hypothetical protein
MSVNWEGASVRSPLIWLFSVGCLYGNGCQTDQEPVATQALAAGQEIQPDPQGEQQKERELFFKSYALKLAGAYENLGALESSYDEKGYCGTGCSVWNYTLSHDQYVIVLSKYELGTGSSRLGEMTGRYSGYILLPLSDGSSFVRLDLEMEFKGNALQAKVLSQVAPIIQENGQAESDDVAAGVVLFDIKADLPEPTLYQALIRRIVRPISRVMSHPPSWELADTVYTSDQLQAGIKDTAGHSVDLPKELHQELTDKCVSGAITDTRFRTLVVSDPQHDRTLQLLLGHNAKDKKLCSVLTSVKRRS